jgi:hypothetical protein
LLHNFRNGISGRDLYETKTDGTVEFYAQAFGDTEGFRTSVDRAKLCGNDPQYTLGTFSGGVVSLVTLDIRSIEAHGMRNEITASEQRDEGYVPLTCRRDGGKREEARKHAKKQQACLTKGWAIGIRGRK